MGHFIYQKMSFQRSKLFIFLSGNLCELLKFKHILPKIYSCFGLGYNYHLFAGSMAFSVDHNDINFKELQELFNSYHCHGLTIVHIPF